MQRCLVVLLAAATLIAGCDRAQPAAPSPPTLELAEVDPVGGALIAFVRPDAGPLEQRFVSDALPAVRSLAREHDARLAWVDASRGAPPEITGTPALVFQNWRGRSVYYGRYTSLERLRTALRAFRIAPQGAERLELTDTPVWESGRARIAAPLKFAAVTGTPPPDYDHEAFVADARRAVLRGFRRLVPATTTLARTDRMFYMDFNPWRSPEGQLYLSVSLYSQFDCHEPVFTNNGNPLVGPFEQLDRLYGEAGLLLEHQLQRQLESSSRGDGFTPLPATTPVRSWEELGLAMPPPPAAAPPAAASDVSFEHPGWRLLSPSPEAPGLTFRFAPPLDGYAGEVAALTGSIRFAAGPDLAGAVVRIEADPGSVTMGEPDLDREIHASMLAVEQFPTSDWESAEWTITGPGRLQFGRQTPARIGGTLRLRGVETPLTVDAFFEPVVAADGQPRLTMSGAFALDIRAFELDGPPGPEPATHTMLFDFQLLFAPEPAGK